MRFLKTPYDLPLIVFWLVALLAVVANICIPYPGVRGLSKEIYQVRGQLQITRTDTLDDGTTRSGSQTTIFLRNGRGKDFQIQLDHPMPGDTYFVKPERNGQGKWILAPVKNIKEEQELEKMHPKEREA